MLIDVKAFMFIDVELFQNLGDFTALKISFTNLYVFEFVEFCTVFNLVDQLKVLKDLYAIKRIAQGVNHHSAWALFNWVIYITVDAHNHTLIE